MVNRDREDDVRLGFAAGWEAGWGAAMLRVAGDLEAAEAPPELVDRFRAWAKEPDEMRLNIHGGPTGRA